MTSLKKKHDEYHLFWTNFLPHRVVLDSMFQRVSDTSREFKRHKIHLQDTTLHHDLHAIGRNAGGVVHGVLEHGWWEIGVEWEAICLSCMFDVDLDGSHGKLIRGMWWCKLRNGRDCQPRIF